MSASYRQIQQTVAFIRRRTDFSPRYGIILGTGLSGLADEIETVKEMSYAVLPHFPVSTVTSHRGKLIFGRLAGDDLVDAAVRQSLAALGG